MKEMYQEPDSKILSYNPGLILISGDYINSDVDKNLIDLISEVPDDCIKVFSKDDWLKGWLITRSGKGNSFFTINDELMVLVDGYLSDLVDIQIDTDHLKDPARTLAMLYRKFGIKFLKSLRGSYSFIILDFKSSTSYVVVDRHGSRPYFYSFLNKRSMFLSSDLKLLVNSDEKNKSIAYSSACEFIASGRFYGRHTLFENTEKLGQAKIITVSRNTVKIKKYWELNFQEDKDVINEIDLIEEFDVVFRKAIQRILKVTDNSFLFLSGGIDSRLILAYLLSEDTKTPVVSFGMNNGPEDDWAISERVAMSNNLELLRYKLEIEDFDRCAEQVVKWTGSIVEVIDSPSLVAMWNDLSSRFGTFINGDECFGWKPHVNSYEKALNSSVIFRMGQVSRLCKWLNKEHKKNIIETVDKDLDSLIENYKMADPDNTKDKLYYKERLYNEVNAFTAPKLKFFEQARPLIDEDVIDFVSKLPAQYRCRKTLYQSVLKNKFPDLLAPGFAVKTSLPKPLHYRELFKRSKTIVSFIKQELLDGINNDLSNIFDMDNFKHDVGAILNNSNLMPLSNRWNRLPGLWRFQSLQPENRTDPVTLMLRVLQLSIYLNTIEK